MTATLDTMTKKKGPAEEPAELAAARELVRQAKEQGLRWKPALNTFSITFADRFPAAETY